MITINKKVTWKDIKNSSTNIGLFFNLLLNKRKRFRFINLMKKIGFWLFIIGFILILLGFYEKSNIVLYETVKAKDEVKFENIRETLGLNDCRVVQNEDSHITNRGGHVVYGQDIACVRGKSFEVTAPLWKDKYLVVKKSYDDRLGDYIVLKHGEYQFIFAHTKSELNTGDRVKSGDVIGKINKSGLSENYHLHFELWKNDYNISLKEITEGKTTFNMEYTYALRKQRKWNLETDEAIKFITDFEGFRKCAYFDGKQYSIGYGTKAKSKTECITKEQAKKRIRGHVESLLENIYKNHFVKYSNQRIALVSATYNLGMYSNITEVKNLKTEKSIKKHFEKYSKAGGKVLRGLKKRRIIERDLYLNKV